MFQGGTPLANPGRDSPPAGVLCCGERVNQSGHPHIGVKRGTFGHDHHKTPGLGQKHTPSTGIRFCQRVRGTYTGRRGSQGDMSLLVGKGVPPR